MNDASFKKEVIHGRGYATLPEASVEIFEYIEVSYNRERRHSSLGYKSPCEFETTG